MYRLLRNNSIRAQGKRWMSSELSTVKDWLRPINYDDASVTLNKDEESGIATITINHPEMKNAFTGRMMVDLSEAVDSLEQWSTGRGVMLCGAGDAFCSGGDLRMMKQIASGEMGRSMSLLMQDTLTRLHDLPLISVALVHGNALGGGAELTLCTDFRVGCRETTIGFVQAKLGVIPGWGGATRLVRLIGRANALQVLASGKLVRAKEALYIGLVNTLLADVPEEDVQETYNNHKDNTVSWLQQYTRSDSSVLGALKRSVIAASHLPLRDALECERQQFGLVWGGDAHLAALQKGQKHK